MNYDRLHADTIKAIGDINARMDAAMRKLDAQDIAIAALITQIESFVLQHGTDGTDGVDGINGTDGTDGVDYTPTPIYIPADTDLDTLTEIGTYISPTHVIEVKLAGKPLSQTVLQQVVDCALVKTSLRLRRNGKWQ